MKHLCDINFSDLLEVDPFFKGLHVFQKIYWNILTVLLSTDYATWLSLHHPQLHGQLRFLLNINECQLRLTGYPVSRCINTASILEYFFVNTNTPGYRMNPYAPVHVDSIEIPRPPLLKKSPSFDTLPEMYNPGLKFRLIHFTGKEFPDHIFVTIEIRDQLVIIQSFYFCYTINSKYGIIILDGDEKVYVSV